MRIQRSAGIAVAAWVAAAAVVQVDAQGRGGRPTPTVQQWAENPETQKHLASAMKIAGTDLAAQARMFCTNTGPQRMAVARQAAGLPPIPNVGVEPTRVFDNLYFIGMTSQNVWAITTSDGIILIDTMNNTEEAKDVIVAGMKTLGLDPMRIKYIITSHGHPGQTDHTGGAAYLQELTGARVLMHPKDWDLVLPAQQPGKPLAKRDMNAADGQKITLGDTTITLMHIPGHTPGSLGVIIPVKDHGTPRTVMTLSATEMPTQESFRQFQHAFSTYAKPAKVEAALNMHPNGLQETLDYLEAIRKNPNAPNPFLYGPDRFARWMDIMLECGKGRLLAMGIQP